MIRSNTDIASCRIAASEIVTALGQTPSHVFERILRLESGLRRLDRSNWPEVITDVAGQIPAELNQQIIELARREVPAWASVQTFRLAWYAGRQLLAKTRPDGDISLVVSTTKAGLCELQTAIDRHQRPATGLYNPGFLAGALQQSLSLTGSITAIASACESGLAALIHAARLIRSKQATNVLVLATDAIERFTLAGFSALRGLSVGACMPFDADRTGLSLGEGAAAILLTAETGEKDGIFVQGWGQSMDANHITGPSRSGDGLAAAISSALKQANCSAGSIHMVNAHGTGTEFNDEMEAKALKLAFGACDFPVASFKGAIGHTLGAAGAIEAVLTAEALVRKTAPPTVGLNKPGVSVPLNLLTRPLPLETMDRALTVKSGFGGVNAAVILTRRRADQ